MAGTRDVPNFAELANKSGAAWLWQKIAKFCDSSLFHWQHILSTGRLPAFKPVAIVLAAAPLVANVAIVAPLSTPGFWFIWSGSVMSLLAFAVTWVRCPAFIRNNENYDVYQKKGHSPRWILWEFYNNFVDQPEAMKRLLKESIEKGISFAASSVQDPLIYGAAPITIPPENIEAAMAKPVNANRDLYLPFWIGGERFVMSIQEDDPKATAKERELFWIISSNLLSSRPVSRFVNWLLYAVTAGLFVTALLINMAQPIYRGSDAPLSLSGRIVKAIFVLLGI
ncbi:hypothetical protein EV128_108211 [Rhizobium azibense]|nr:hypothetical protein EV128_108211 [Rhizobium azibense]